MNWKERSREVEEMDDLDMSGEKLEKTLRDLSKVHRLLGGHQQVFQIMDELMEIDSGVQSIVDLGCGGGDSLHSMAEWGKKRRILLDLYGMDANAAIISYARDRMGEKSEAFSVGNVFSRADLEKYKNVDVAFFSLFLHHFSDEEIQSILQSCSDLGIKYIVITDLQRSVWAYRLFSVATKFISFSKMAREDGLLSIQKGFHRKELRQIIDSSPYRDIHTLEWKWAFRYVLIAELQNHKSNAP
jgi:2-polyprenyl-3-methyl-5-hydroxy-6-metoxy-1,4-benzoquinol methylase